MINVKEFIYEQLINEEALSGYIGNRIYPSYAPLGTDMPLIIYNRIGSTIDVKGIRNETLQISIWGQDINENEKIMHIIIPLLNGLKTPPIKYVYIKGINETFDSDTKSYGIHITVHIKMIEI